MSPRPQSNAMVTELEAALDYARHGIPVFPTNPLDKKPLTANGFKDATVDEVQIREWWTRWPNAMIAAPTGIASAMWVVDLDLHPVKKTDGAAALAQLIAQHGEIPKTLMTITPRGGRHLIFVWDRSIEIRNSAGKIGPGIDVRGEGGYVCLPPSRNANGGSYRWDPDGADQAVPAPTWLIELARSKPKARNTAWARAALDRECNTVASAQPGRRNDTLNTSAFNLYQIVAGGGLDEQEVYDRLFAAAQACGLVADDGAASVEATINSAARAARAQPRTRPQLRPQRTGPRPTIQVVAGQLPRLINEIEDALLASGAPIFCRAGMLVEPVTEEVPAADGRKTLTAKLRALSVDSLLEPIAEAAVFQSFNRKRNAWVDIDPPLQLVRMILARARQWAFPRVSGIITTPTLRADGSLLAAPGYDPQSGLYLLPTLQLPLIPEHPTKEQARSALDTLIDLLSEFPFAKSSNPSVSIDRSVALAALLTAHVRGALPTAPIFLVRADTPGTGKSYLVDLFAMISTGRLCPVITASKSIEETEKRLSTVLLDGSNIVSLDNVTHDLGGELLCQLTERPVIKVRILGRSEMPECESRTMTCATGNNVTFWGDAVRRGLTCNIEAQIERPELREFKRDTLAHAAANRGTLVAATLTAMRAYIEAGAPRVCGPFGSYAEWSRMVRSPLIWLGEPDPITSMDAARGEDPVLTEIRELFGFWRDYDLAVDLHERCTCNRVIEVACMRMGGGSVLDLNPRPFEEFLLRAAGDKNGKISPVRLGMWLRKISGRVVDGYRLEHSHDGRHATFWLRKM
jgi:Bifunctional DNA primase/polymerase, N-terminal